MKVRQCLQLQLCLITTGNPRPKWYLPARQRGNDLISAKNLVISKMTPRDLDEVLAIERQSYPTPWSRHAFTSELTANVYAHYFTARLDGKLVGYFGMWVFLTKPISPT